MNAVDRFSNTMARYRQQIPPTPQPVYPQASYPAYPQQVRSVQPQPRSDVEKALDKVAEVTPVLSRLAALVNRVQSPPPTEMAGPGVAAMPPQGPIGQSLQRLGQAVGSSDVDRFVRQAAPVIDEAVPLIEDILNLANGKSPQAAAPQAVYQPYGTAPQAPSISQQVGSVVDGLGSLAAGVNSMVKAFEGLFKR